MRSLISLFSLTRHLSASFPGQSGSCAVRILLYTPLDSLTSPITRQLLERCFRGAAAKLTSTGWLSTSLSRLRQCRRTRYVGILKPGNRQAITGLLQATIGSTPNCSQVDARFSPERCLFHLSVSLRCRATRSSILLPDFGDQFGIEVGGALGHLAVLDAHRPAVGLVIGLAVLPGAVRYEFDHDLVALGDDVAHGRLERAGEFLAERLDGALDELALALIGARGGSIFDYGSMDVVGQKLVYRWTVTPSPFLASV